MTTHEPGPRPDAGDARGDDTPRRRADGPHQADQAAQAARTDLADALLEASLEVALGGRAGPALTARIVAALQRDALHGDPLHGDPLHGDALYATALDADTLHGDALAGHTDGRARPPGRSGRSPIALPRTANRPLRPARPDRSRGRAEAPSSRWLLAAPALAALLLIAPGLAWRWWSGRSAAGSRSQGAGAAVASGSDERASREIAFPLPVAPAEDAASAAGPGTAPAPQRPGAYWLDGGVWPPEPRIDLAPPEDGSGYDPDPSHAARRPDGRRRVPAPPAAPPGSTTPSGSRGGSAEPTLAGAPRPPAPAPTSEPTVARVEVPSPDTDPRVVAIEGKPRIRPVGATTWTRIEKGDRLPAGAAIDAGQGHLDLGLPGGALARVGGKARLLEPEQHPRIPAGPPDRPPAEPAPPGGAEPDPDGVPLPPHGVALALALDDGTVYVDATWLPATAPALVLVEAGGVVAVLDAAVGLVEGDAKQVEIAHYAGCGSVAVARTGEDGSGVVGGSTPSTGAVLRCAAGRLRGVRRYDGARHIAGHRLLRERRLERALVRVDFDTPPPGITAGVVRNGACVAEGDGGSIELDLAEGDRPALAGAVLRFGLRASGVHELVVQVWAPAEQRNYRWVLSPVPGSAADGFALFEAPLADFRQTLDPSRPLEPGTLLRNLQLHAYGPGARIEVDWIEVRWTP